jgi:hypothetical protein
MSLFLRLAEQIPERYRGRLSPELLLLPLLDDSLAGPVLRDAGVTRAMVESLLDEMQGEADGDHCSYEPNSGWWEMEGFARGFAAAMGQSLQPVHALIAQLWTRHWWLIREVEPEAVRDSLVARGVPIPARPLPREFREGEPVYLTNDELKVVLAHIHALLPRGAEFAFNWENGDERAHIAATEGVDLEPIVRRILAEHPA